MRRVDNTPSSLKEVEESRRPKRDRDVHRIVADILERIEVEGDAALLDLSRRFDAPELDSVEVELDELAGPEFPMIKRAIERVREFHLHQRQIILAGWTPAGEVSRWQKNDEIIGQVLRPLTRVGVYIPGGRATYPSSVYMNVLPAIVAGVSEIVVATPAQPDGTLPDAVKFALRSLGITEIYKLGGAQAIGAMALGTDTIRRVDKIVGPGNQWVNEAKRQVWGNVGLDGYAGPSEVAVVVDDNSNYERAAVDFLTQIEHAPDNIGYLIALSESALKSTEAEIESLVLNAPRAEIIRAALADQSFSVVVQTKQEALNWINAIAPEHLSLAVSNAESWIEQIQNSGCILIGEEGSESMADYCIGPSHTLPTSGAARFQSPLNVMDFMKVQSYSWLSSEDAHRLTLVASAIGELEGLPMHAFGAQLRSTF